MTRGISTTRPFSHTDYPRQEEEKTACPKLPSHYDGTNFHLSKKRIICVKDYVALWMANKSNLATKVIYVELRPSNSAQHGFIILLSHPLAPTDLLVPPNDFQEPSISPHSFTLTRGHTSCPRRADFTAFSGLDKVDQYLGCPIYGCWNTIMYNGLCLRSFNDYWHGGSPWGCDPKAWDWWSEVSSYGP